MPSNIYNVKNRTLKQMFVGITQIPVEQLKAHHHRSPPPKLSHWDFKNHDIFYEEIQKEVPEKDVGFFIQNYSMLTGLPGWKTIFEESAAG